MAGEHRDAGEGGDASQRSGEYTHRGDYHRHLDPSWSYYPVYVRKLAFVERFIERQPLTARLLDVGCGEGVLVEKYHQAGRDIVGLDLNYAAPRVQRGDVRDLPFAVSAFDVVLMLDVIEHLTIPDQPRALAEVHRVLRDGGELVIAIPNLAHLASRLSFLTGGRLARTATVEKHPGDRPIEEYLRLLAEAGFVIRERIGIQLTLPERLTAWLRRLVGRQRLERFTLAPERDPELCFLNLIVAVR